MVRRIGLNRFSSLASRRLRIPTILVLVVASHQSLLFAQEAESTKRFQGKVISSSVTAYSEPSFRSALVTSFSKNDLLDIRSQTKNWYRIEILFIGGTSGDAWVPKRDVELVGRADESQARGVISADRRSTSISEEAQVNPNPFDFRITVAPVFSLYRYGANQIRLGAALRTSLNELLSVGFPFSYSFGEGFKTLQGGLEGTYYFHKFNRFKFYSRTGALFERLFGNGRSFLALSVDQGIGTEYLFSERFWIAFEPISVEWMAWRSKDVPWNLRGQVMVSAGMGW